MPTAKPAAIHTAAVSHLGLGGIMGTIVSTRELKRLGDGVEAMCAEIERLRARVAELGHARDAALGELAMQQAFAEQARAVNAELLAALRGAMVIIDAFPCSEELTPGLAKAFDARRSAVVTAVAKAEGAA